MYKRQVEKDDTTKQIHSNQSQLKDHEAQHQSRIDKFQQLKNQQDLLKQQVMEAMNQAQVKVEACNERKETYISKSSLLESLKKLRTQFEGFHEGIKSLMSQQNGERISGIREVLVEVLQTPSEYESAIETALGDKLESVIFNS